jgi:SusD family
MKIHLLLVFFFNHPHPGDVSPNSSKYLSLLRTAIFHHTFIDKLPLRSEGFLEAQNYAISILNADTIGDIGLSAFDFDVFKSLTGKNQKLDTAIWLDEEIPDCPLVKKGEKVKRSYALKKLKPTNKRDKRFYSSYLKYYNRSNSNSKKLTYTFSRPVFDNSKNYALVEEFTSKSNWGCYFYKWDGETWRQIINIATRN